MEWFILFVIIIMYCDLSSQIKKLNKNQNVNKHKDYSILKSMIDKK